MSNKRGKTGGNKRVMYRRHMRRTKGYMPLYFGVMPLGVNTARSLMKLFFEGVPVRGRAREIYDEWRKVRKRMDELIAEGYDFDTDEFRDIYMGNLPNSKKTLERLQGLKKKQLRREATAYKGITDKVEMRRKYNAEVQARKAATKAAKEAAKKTEEDERDRIRKEQAKHDEEALGRIPRDLDIKIQNLIEEERQYIQTLLDRVNKPAPISENYPYTPEQAEALAEKVINVLLEADDRTKQAVVDVIERKGGVGPTGDLTPDWQLFDYIPKLNEEYLESIPGAKYLQDYLDTIDGDEFIDFTKIKPASYEDEGFLPQDYDDIPF